MQRVAVIDVGSNSTKLLLAEHSSNGTLKTVLDTTSITGLGEGLRQSRRLSPEAKERTCRTINEFAALAKQYRADQIIAIGTMALRGAQNSSAFIEMVKATSGIDIRVISGEEEASLSYLATLSGIKLHDCETVIFDTGGGSTEFIFGKGESITRKLSVNLGVITISEEYFISDPPTQAQLEIALCEIKEILTAHKINGPVPQLVGIGGTVTTMGAVKQRMERYDPEAIQGSTLQLSEVNEQIAEFSSKTLEERKQIRGLEPKRAPIILAGACIVKIIMELLQNETLVISDRGIRHGLALNLLRQT
ncbi:MAG: Ppx/GppA family phosphatase [Dethiobacter sp.]|nr:Ppx/GppA family phosphatase [Dethiobacter sp.]